MENVSGDLLFGFTHPFVIENIKMQKINFSKLLQEKEQEQFNHQPSTISQMMNPTVNSRVFPSNIYPQVYTVSNAPTEKLLPQVFQPAQQQQALNGITVHQKPVVKRIVIQK